MQNLKRKIQARNHLKKAIREFFDERGFVEVDTPVLVKCPGTELHLNYFKTEWKDYQKLAHPLWMRSSPELALKRVLAAGLPAIYQVAPSFRNEGECSQWHHPEFMMLEYYKTKVDWDSFFTLSCDLIRNSISELSKSHPVQLKPNMSLTKITVAEAFKNFVGIDLIDGDTDLSMKAKKQGVLSVSGKDDFETAYFKILLEKIEPELAKLEWVLLYDYPASQAALARVQGSVAKRFEFYIKGVELSNGFYELCDPKENIRRIQEVNKERVVLNKEVVEDDIPFYQALEQGLPDCFGNAMGFDRLLALILGFQDIGEVIPFREDPPWV